MRRRTWQRINKTLRNVSLLIGAVLLVTTSAFAYRTGEDLPELDGASRVAWAEPEVQFFLSRDGLPSALAEERVEAALQSAFDVWRATACAVVAPTFGGWVDTQAAQDDGANTIAWSDDWASRNLPDSAPGDTDISYRSRAGGWQIAEADILLNAANFDWTELSLELVLAHEVGHALGLLHPCEEGGRGEAPACEVASDETLASLMYPSYGETRSVELGTDDVAGICYLYPNGDDCGGSCGPRQMCIDSECRTLCEKALCQANEQCGYWGCVPEGVCTARDCTGQSCDGATVCGPLLKCAGGICAAGRAPWGDECDSNSDCADGACAEHACRPACRTDDDCGASGRCVHAGGSAAGGCVASAAFPLGARCAQGEDCQSGLCVLGDGGNRCTTDCDNDKPCPFGWRCDSIHGRRACAPPVPEEGLCSISVASSGGTRFHSSGTPSHSFFIVLFAASAALFVARKPRNRPA